MINFFDLTKQQKILSSHLDKNIGKVLKHHNHIQGQEVRLLENKLANYISSKYCVTTASGTDSLLLALMSLDIKKDDEIITSPFSFVSAVEVINLLGAKPIFVDIDPLTYNIDSDKIENKITNKTKAIMPISMFGQMSNLTQINKIATKYKIPVIEDAAQSFGARFKNNYSCNFTTIGCTSFFPTKPLGCYGDGGACFTNNSKISKKIRSLSLHGKDKNKFYYKYAGINSRLDTIQAAILLAKIKVFNKEIKLRNKVANYYNYLLKELTQDVQLPFIKNNYHSVYAQYTIQTNKRNELKKYLYKNNIPSIIYYPLSLNKIKYINSKDSCPNSERVVKRVLSLPFHPYMKKQTQEFIVSKIYKFFK